MSADVTIRRLRSDDGAAFKAIRLEALTANPELLRSTFELEDKLDVAWFAGRLENAYIIGAFRNDKLLGTAGFSVQKGGRMLTRAGCSVCTFDQPRETSASAACC